MTTFEIVAAVVFFIIGGAVVVSLVRLNWPWDDAGKPLPRIDVEVPPPRCKRPRRTREE